MKLKIALLYSLVFVFSNSFAANVMFACNMAGDIDMHIVFSTSNNKAELITEDSHINGSVTVNEHLYVFKFPSTRERYEIHAIVNRYSGKLKWETGSPPFGSSSSKNIQATGTCKKSKVKKVL